MFQSNTNPKAGIASKPGPLLYGLGPEKNALMRPADLTILDTSYVLTETMQFKITVI
ncbi:MAG: hypothetical protein ABWZ25_15720 [Chitinophagaceae bacterium]